MFFFQVPTSWEVVGLKSASVFFFNASGNTRMIDYQMRCKESFSIFTSFSYSNRLAIENLDLAVRIREGGI